MKTKLTLRLNEELIKNAKEYSAKSGKPVSKIVADLFTVTKKEKLRKNYKITPAVNRIILEDALKSGFSDFEDSVLIMGGRKGNGNLAGRAPQSPSWLWPQCRLPPPELLKR